MSRRKRAKVFPKPPVPNGARVWTKRDDFVQLTPKGEELPYTLSPAHSRVDYRPASQPRLNYGDLGNIKLVTVAQRWADGSLMRDENGHVMTKQVRKITSTFDPRRKSYRERNSKLKANTASYINTARPGRIPSPANLDRMLGDAALDRLVRILAV